MQDNLGENFVKFHEIFVKYRNKSISRKNLKSFNIVNKRQSQQDESIFFGPDSLVAAVESTRIFCHSRLKDMNQIWHCHKTLAMLNETLSLFMHSEYLDECINIATPGSNVSLYIFCKASYVK